MPRGGKRPNAGRPQGTTKGDGLATKVHRVSSEITKEQLDALPSLIAVLDYWEDECKANPDNPRHHFLRQALDEIRALGY